MTPEQAAWVREHVWPKAMAGSLAPTDVCPCQYGPSTWCLHGVCHRCEPADAVPFPETCITDKAGLVRSFAVSPYTHPTVSAAGSSRSVYAMVWLADRVCRWACPHDCHQAPSAPLRAVEQLDLFAEVA